MRTQIILLSIGITAVIFDLIISIYQAITEYRKQLKEFNEDYDTTNTTTAFHKTNKTSSTPRSARPRTYTTTRPNAPHQNSSSPHQNRRGSGRCSGRSSEGVAGGVAGSRSYWSGDDLIIEEIDEEPDIKALVKVPDYRSRQTRQRERVEELEAIAHGTSNY